jgi:fibronectin type 3 domain-containing protein
MSIKSLVRSFVVVVTALSGLNACAGLHLSSTEQDINAPSTVTATAVSDTRISVSWTAVPGALSYLVFDKLSTDPTFVFVGTTLDPGTSQLVIGLTPNTSYDFQVITESTDGTASAPSTLVSATTFAVAPGAPTNIVATAVSNTEIDLSWTDFPTATAVYVLESQAGGPFNFLTTVLAPGDTFSATGLVTNTMYCYQLVSQLADGSLSGASTPAACATTGAGPQPPTGLIATAISDTRILVQWQPATGAAQYNVFQSQAGGPFTFTGDVLASEQSFAAVNLMPATSYCYRVSTVFPDDSESAQSSSACATTLPTNNNGAFEGYWKLDELSGTTAIDSSGFNRNGTITNAAYSLADKAQLDDNRSAISFTASPDSAITVAPAPGLDLLVPFTVAFWAKLPAAADVEFIGMRGAGCGALGWEIAQDASGLHFAGQTQTVAAGASVPAGVWTHVAVTYSSGTMQTFVNGVQTASAAFVPDNTLQAPLNMGHVAGCAGGAVLMDDVFILSRAMSSTEISAIGTLPPPPTNLHVTSTTSATVAFAWDPVPGAVRYIISKGTASGAETFFTHSPADPPAFGDGHLTPNTQFFYTVRVVVGNLFSNASSELVATTDPPPAAPTNVTATVVPPDRIQVQWSPVTSAFKYFVFESVNGGPSTVVGVVLAPDTSFQAVNLAPMTTYTFQIQAEDAVGTDGPMSQPASATTP